MHKRILIVTVITLLILTANAIFAQPAGNNPRRGGKTCGCMGWGRQIAQQLNLTQDQISRLKAIHDQFMQDTQSQRQELMTRVRELANLWSNGTSTTEELTAKADQIDALKTQIRNTAISYMVQTRSILTPDQLQKVREWIASKPHLGMGWMCPMFSESDGACAGGKRGSGRITR